MAQSGTSSNVKPTNAVLKARINELEKEVATLKATPRYSLARGLRKVSVFLLVIICALMLNLTTLSLWLKRNVINTDVWVTKTSALMANESVRSDVANRITDEIFAATDAEQVVAEIIPPRISALSVPLTNNLKRYTTEKTTELLASQKFQTFWQNANRSAHAGIISSLENGGNKPANTDEYIVYIENEKLLLNLKPIIQQLQSDLTTAGLGFVSNLNTSNISRTITLTEIKSLPTVLTVFEFINRGARIFIFIGIAAGAAAIALAKRKRKVLIAICTTTILLMVLNVQAVYLARYPAVKQVTDSITATSTNSATAVIDIMTKDLVSLNRTLMGLALIILVIAVLTGSSKLATQFRTLIAKISTPKQSNRFISFISNNKSSLAWMLTAVGAILIIFPPAGGAMFPLLTVGIIGLICLWMYSIPKK